MLALRESSCLADSSSCPFTSLQILIETVEGVYFEHIAADDGAAGGQFLLQTGNLGCIGSLHLLQFLEEFLRAELFLGELCQDGVVIDLRLEFAVLAGELLILVFHFLLVEFGQFLHGGIFLFLLIELQGEPRCSSCQKKQDDDQRYENFFLHFMLLFFFSTCKSIFFIVNGKEKSLSNPLRMEILIFLRKKWTKLKIISYICRIKTIAYGKTWILVSGFPSLL